MKSLNKNNKQFIILVGVIATLLLFQNCAKQFISQCTTDCQDWRSIVAATEEADEFQKVSFYDEKQFEILSKSQNLVAYYSKNIPQNEVQSKFFGEEFASIVQIPGSFQGMVFNIFSENQDAEAARMMIEGSHIVVEHSTATGEVYRLRYPAPIQTEDMIIAVYFGIRVLDIRMVINGKLLTADDNKMITDLVGAPVNYSYLEKNLWVSETASDLLIFNRKLSTYELASVSRYLGNLHELSQVTYDDNIKVDSDVNFIQERPQFLAARQILKTNSCFKCHGSWVNYGEYNYIANGLIKENSAANSPLWTRLAGTLELNKQNKKKDMPLKQNPLKNEELDILKVWIMSFTSAS